MISKKIKIILIMIIILLTSIFTIVTKDIKVSKKTEIDQKIELEKFNKNIKFSKSKENSTEPYLEFNGKVQEQSPIVSSDGKTITFETPVFENVGDKATIYYWVTNENEQSAKIEELICEKHLENSTEIKDEYIEIISKDELKDQQIAGGKTTRIAGSLEIILKKLYKGTEDKITYKITCKVNAKRND